MLELVGTSCAEFIRTTNKVCALANSRFAQSAVAKRNNFFIGPRCWVNRLVSTACHRGCKEAIRRGDDEGRILTLPPERGRSPPAARRSVEEVCSIPEPLCR